LETADRNGCPERGPLRAGGRRARGIGLEQAAALGIPFMTAHRCLFADGSISDRRVLVVGSAGAVGYAAIQLAKRGGAYVIATVSTPEKAALAKEASERGMTGKVLVDTR
jgi:NADPH2:quinone reductase